MLDNAEAELKISRNSVKNSSAMSLKFYRNSFIIEIKNYYRKISNKTNCDSRNENYVGHWDENQMQTKFPFIEKLLSKNISMQLSIFWDAIILNKNQRYSNYFKSSSATFTIYHFIHSASNWNVSTMKSKSLRIFYELPYS